MLQMRAVAGVNGHPTMDGLLKMLMLFVKTAQASPTFTPLKPPSYASDPCMLWLQVQEMKKDIATLKRWIQIEQSGTELPPLPQEQDEDEEESSEEDLTQPPVEDPDAEYDASGIMLKMNEDRSRFSRVVCGRTPVGTPNQSSQNP